MNLKSFFKLKFILFSLVAIYLGCLLKLKPFLFQFILWEPFWFVIRSAPLRICTLMMRHEFFGWPFPFLISTASPDCGGSLWLNPIGLLLNFALFLVVGKIIFWRKN